MASGKIVVKQLRSCASSAASGQATFTAVNDSYISAPRAYRGHTFSFEATDDYKITKVVFTYASGNAGLGLIVGDTLNTSASLTTPKNSAATAVTGGVGVVSDTTNYTATKNTSALTWTIQVNNSAGTDTLYAQNYDNNTSTATTQLRPTAISISYIVGNEVLAPDTITVTGNAALTAGQQVQFSVECKNGGSATGVGQDVTWSSSDTSVAIVSSTGKVSALSNGTANIIATSALNSVTGQLAVTVSGSATDKTPKTISTDNLGFNTNAYADWNGIHSIDGFVVETNAVARQGGDYTPDGGSTIYEKYAFVLQKNNGKISTLTNAGANINKVIIIGVSSTAPTINVKGGNTIGATSSTATLSSSGNVHTYTFSSPVTYVTIQEKNSGATYFHSVTFEFVGGVDNAKSLARYILGLIPNRNDVINLCLGTSGNYALAKARYAAASAEVRSAFETDTDEVVVSARARYVQWAAVYGDATPFATTISSNRIATILNNNGNYVIWIVVITSIIGISVAGFLLTIRKRKEQR